MEYLAAEVLELAVTRRATTRRPA
nr:unnamed protein product [Callosobruchus chinensis]